MTSIIKGLLLGIFFALLGAVFMGHQAHAGGPIMAGKSFVQGTDVISGTTYGDPSKLFSNNSDARTLRVYPGASVSFSFLLENWDPFPVAGIVNTEYHSVDFTGQDTLIAKDEPKNYVGLVRGLPSKYWHINKHTVTLNGPGSDVPGSRYCAYVQTDPTVYDFLNPVNILTGGVTLGLHKFNKNPDAIIFPLTVLQGVIFPLGNVMSCAEIAYNYNLVPNITLGNPDSSRIPVTPSVTQGTLKPNTNPTSSQQTLWQITQFYLPTSREEPGMKDQDSRNPCVYAGSFGATSCTKVGGSESADTTFDKNGFIDSAKPNTPFPSSVTFGHRDGFKTCYMLSVNAYAPYLSSSPWRHSKVVCTEGARKSPKIQVLGDDVRVGGRIETSVTDLAKRFGSWGEYASYSVGENKGFGTAAGLREGSGTDQAQYSALTFANAQSNYGNFSSDVTSRGAKNVQQYFSQNTQSGLNNPIDLSTLVGSVKPYKIDNKDTGPLVISGGNIEKGKTIIIVATGTVNITGNIDYTTDQLSSIADIPQVVIVAHDINIASHVKNIDAWLIASIQGGTINTCSPAPVKLTKSDCSQQLRVNGPVVTNHLLLNRTAGSEDGNPGEPAEIFNNRGDVYLWAQYYAVVNDSLLTTRQIELPPRY